MTVRRKKKSMGWNGRILLSFLLIFAVVFLPTTVLLFIGMLPTIVARVADRSPDRSRALTIGFMNFAGCFPFWFQLVEDGHKFENAVVILSQPSTIVIMYAAALAGYLVEWSLAGIVAGMVVQRGNKRLKEIEELQQAMTVRWGNEVTGDVPLDAQGFPIENKMP
jgi:hypothetical protein